MQNQAERKLPEATGRNKQKNKLDEAAETGLHKPKGRLLTFFFLWFESETPQKPPKKKQSSPKGRKGTYDIPKNSRKMIKWGMKYWTRQDSLCYRNCTYYLAKKRRLLLINKEM